MKVQPESGAARLTGLGLLVFAVGTLAILYWMLRPGEHPLALQRDVPLCEALTPGLQAIARSVGTAVIAAAPQNGGRSRSICLLVDQPGHAPAASPAATELARIVLTTEADVRHGGPGESFGRYVNTFVAEMKASGWVPIEVRGPWLRTYAFRHPNGEVALLIDDDGVFLWIVSRRLTVAGLLAGAEALTAQLRKASPPGGAGN
jgi:hypothetical protein